MIGTRGAAAARITVALLAVGGLAAGCAQLDDDELTDVEWERLQSLSTGHASVPDVPEGVPEIQSLLGASCLPQRVRGLGLPPADCSNKLTWSPFISDLSSCPGADDPNEWVPDDVLPRLIALGRALYHDPGFSGVATHKDILGQDVAFGRVAKGDPVKVSCADCHDPRRDGIDRSDAALVATQGAVSIGAGIYDVNSQPTVNAAYYKIFYWNGRSDALWTQITAVNESGVSMNSRRNQDFWRILDTYWAEKDLFTRGLEYEAIATLPPAATPPDTDGGMGFVPRTAVAPGEYFCDPRYAPYREAVNRVYVNYAKIVAAYEQTLVRGDSDFDRFVAAGRNSTALSARARHGARLFVGKAACFDCHNGPLFSDSKFHNVGVPQTGAGVPTVEDCGRLGCTCEVGFSTNDKARKCAPWGAWDGLGKLRQGRFRRDSHWSDDAGDTSVSAFLQSARIITGPAAPETDAQCPTSFAGLAAAPIANTPYGIPEQLGPELVGAWRTPTLRDVAATGPYMHNGAYATLEDVVWHYNQGGTTAGLDEHARRNIQITPLDLTDDEQRDLIEFLHALTSRATLPAALTAQPADGSIASGNPCPDEASSGP
jgi:cytochrome c peroxidase